MIAQMGAAFVRQAAGTLPNCAIAQIHYARGEIHIIAFAIRRDFSGRRSDCPDAGHMGPAHPALDSGPTFMRLFACDVYERAEEGNRRSPSCCMGIVRIPLTAPSTTKDW